MSQLISITFLKKEKIAKDTYAFYLERKPSIDFIPGQYISLFITVNGKVEFRDFSIASSPMEKKMLMLVIKKGLSNYKKTLFRLDEGSQINITKPSGGFILNENDITQKVFLAGGIGITPFYSMATYIYEKEIHIPLTLFVSFSEKEYVIYFNELKAIEKENPLVKVVYSLSQDYWDGEHGRISSKLLEKYIRDIKEPLYYLCGGQDMVDDTYELLLRMGIQSDKIKVEYFTGY